MSNSYIIIRDISKSRVVKYTMHTIQKNLLRRLVGRDDLTFARLTEGYTSDDNVVFHVKQLIQREFIKKVEQRYILTATGLRESGKFDKVTLEDKEFKNIFIGFIISHGEKYMLREHTSINGTFYKFPGAKPFLGEDMAVARVRLLQEEFEILNAIPYPETEYFGIHFKIQKTSRDKVLFDDALTLYKVDVSAFAEEDLQLKKHNRWFSKEEISMLSGKWPEIDFCIFDPNNAHYKEYSFINDYNLSE